MNDFDEYLSPWYKVLDSEGSYLFEVRFYCDPTGSGFTFDAEGNDWICRKLDSDNLIIYAEPMGDYMNSSINKYHKEYGEETPDDITYGYVEMS